MQKKSLKNRAKQLIYFLTVGLFLLSASVMIKGTAENYTQLARERTSLLNTPDLKEETLFKLKAIQADLSETEQRLAQFRAPKPGVLVPAFIQHLGMLAREEGVTITMISPGSQVSGPVSLVKTPFKLELSGKFSALHRFIARLEKSLLPVRVEEIVMTAGEEDNLDLSLSCYILSEKAIRAKHRGEGPARAVFASLPYQSIENALDIKRDIFSYAKGSSSIKAIKKKRATRTKRSLRKKRPRNPFAKASLNAIVYDGTDSMALINGVALSVGDLYKGYTVKKIGRHQIRFVHPKNKREIVVKEK